jgi:hypothetical protein
MSVASGVYAASIAGAIHVIYKWSQSSGNEADANEFARNIIKTGGFIVLVGLLSVVEPLHNIANMIAWVYTGIIVLNSGTDILKGLGAL